LSRQQLAGDGSILDLKFWQTSVDAIVVKTESLFIDFFNDAQSQITAV